MLRLKINHVSKRGHRPQSVNTCSFCWYISYLCFLNQLLKCLIFHLSEGKLLARQILHTSEEDLGVVHDRVEGTLCCRAFRVLPNTGKQRLEWLLDLLQFVLKHLQIQIQIPYMHWYNYVNTVTMEQIDGLVQERRNSIAKAQGLYSLSGKTSYRQISWSLEAARLDVAMVVSLWNLTGTSAAALPRYLPNFRAIGNV